MATYIKTLVDETTNDEILPRTVASAVTIEDETLETFSVDAVRYSTQIKTNEQQTIARVNINAQEVISDLSTIRAGATSGATAYQKPSGGIPSTDLTATVQTSLGKADTALQEHQSLAAYRTSAAQDIIDAAKQDTLISSGASVNQFLKVTAVDANGKPTSWSTENILFTLTVTCTTQDGVIVTGQTVTVQKKDATGQVYATAAYEGQPVSFSVPKGFEYYVSVSDTLEGHFNPTKASGIVTNANVSVTLTYTDISTIQTFMDIQAALNADADLTNLVGEQVNTSRNNAIIVWDITDYDSEEQEVTLLTHEVLPNSFNVEPSQALLWCETELAAGNYKFAIGSTYYYFTLVNAIPAGGQLRATTTAFYTYSTIQSISAAETGTVSTTEIADATNLGTTGLGLLNHADRVSYGSNNYGESWINQFLNSDAAPNTYLSGLTKFSRPSSVSSYGGFLYNFDEQALACIAETTWKCSANRVYEAPSSLGGITAVNSTYTVTSKIGLASQMEIFGTYDGVPAGDSVYDLYDGATATDRIKYRGTSAQYWWMRSPYPSNAYYVRSVNTSGTLNNVDAYRSYGVVPACKIRKSTNP